MTNNNDPVTDEDDDNDENQNYNFWDLFNRWTFLMIIIWILAYIWGTYSGTEQYNREFGIK